MAADLGWIVGPLVLGAMADAGQWAWGFVVAGVPLLVAGALFLGTGDRRATILDRPSYRSTPGPTGCSGRSMGG